MATIKSFEDFLDRMQGLLDNAKKQGQIIVPIEDLENAFPELKESEDERMVKFIKNQLFNIKKTITENYELDAKLTNAIDWLEKQGEKKSAWTPMDEQHVENLLAIIEGHGYPGEVAWLNSLEDRVQPKQEWSEENKAILEKCIGAVKVSCYSYSFKSEAENWLKSLRPQSQWKPSLSQLNALGIVAKGNPPDDIEEIKSLYNDLHKLIN